MEPNDKFEVIAGILQSGIALQELKDQINNMEKETASLISDGIVSPSDKKNSYIIQLGAYNISTISLLKDVVKALAELNDSIANAINGDEHDGEA